MVRVVLAGHGDWPSGLLSAVEFIAGPRDMVTVCPLAEGLDLEAYTQLLSKALPARDDPCLVLVDLVGGTPWNAAVRLAMERPHIAVVAGTSLPMLLEALMSYNPGMDPADLAAIALRAGMEGLKAFGANVEPEVESGGER